MQPNTAHRTLALWERLGVVSHLITQNVDQLHYKAGSANVIEIHGTNSIVACLDCNYSIHRHPFQGESGTHITYLETTLFKTPDKQFRVKF